MKIKTSELMDRPGIYGEERAALFTRIATAMGEHYVEFEELV